MKTLIILLTLAATASILVVGSITYSTMQCAPNEATRVANEMEQAYGTDWAERLLAAGTTNRDLHVEMLTVYYEAVDANAKSGTLPDNWVGHDYILSHHLSLTRTSYQSRVNPIVAR
jgi:type II secretory pathway pseudopilin PulG